MDWTTIANALRSNWNAGMHEALDGWITAAEKKATENAPGGPGWEGLARMMYDSLTCQHRSCFFCGRTVGHENDCQWEALDREVRDRLKGEGETDS